MRGAFFSSLSEASAALAFGPVRFRCSVCGGVHWSDKKGWQRCAEKFVAGERKSGSSLRFVGWDVHIPAYAVLKCAVPGCVLLGREGFLERFYSLRRKGVPGTGVGSFPALLAVGPEAVERAVSDAHRRWAGQALSLLLEAYALASEFFPDPVRPNLPFPALCRYGDERWSLFLDRFALSRDRGDVAVAFYPGLSLAFGGCEGLAPADVFEALKPEGLRLLDAKGPVLSPKRAVKEVPAVEHGLVLFF